MTPDDTHSVGRLDGMSATLFIAVPTATVKGGMSATLPIAEPTASVKGAFVVS